MKDRTLSLTLAFVIPILFTLAFPYASGDLSPWIALGLYFLKTGTVLRHDIFSALPTTEMVYPAFGSSVLYGTLYPFFGLMGVCIFHAVIVLPILLFILYRPLIRARLLPSSQTLKWALFLFWLGGVPTFGERPAMLALIPLVLSFQIIAGLSKEGFSRNDAVKLLIIQIVWGNLHGSFILLPMMLIWKFFWDFNFSFKKLLLVFLTLLAAGINSFGFRIYPYLLETASMSKERGISEWDFPGLATQFPTGILFWGLLAYTVFFLIQRYRSGDLRQTLRNPFFMFVAMGTLSIRNAALSFVVLLPGAYAAGFFKLAETDSAETSRQKSLANTWVTAIAILAIPAVAVWKPTQWDHDVAFELADQIKKDGRSCAIFNDWELGGFLMLTLPNQTYLDTRNIIYSREEFNQYEQTLRGDVLWKDFLNQGNACFVLVTANTSIGLIEKLKSSGDWDLLASDATHVLYAKKKQ